MKNNILEKEIEHEAIVVMLTGSPGTLEQKLEGKEGDSHGGRPLLQRYSGSRLL